MFGLTRWNAFDDMFQVRRQVDRLFEDFWRDLPARPAGSSAPSFAVNETENGWHIDVPLPGIDPSHVSVEVSGSTLAIRAEEPGEKGAPKLRYQQTLTMPQFLDLDGLSASHRHGMLRLNVPVKESVRPRRITIDRGDEQKRITAAA